MGRCKLEHGLVFWPEPLVKSNGGKRLKRQAMPKCQQPPHTDTPGSGSVLVCIGDICIRICMLMLPLYKQNKQMSKYTRIGDCSTNLLLLLGIHATEVSFGYVCYCSDCFVLLLLLLWNGGISILTALSNTGRPDHGYLQLRQSGLLTPYTARGHLLVFPEFSKFPDFFALRRDRFLYLGWADGRCISVSVVGVCFLRFNYPIVIVVSFQCQNKRKKCV